MLLKKEILSDTVLIWMNWMNKNKNCEKSDLFILVFVYDITEKSNFSNENTKQIYNTDLKNLFTLVA